MRLTLAAALVVLAGSAGADIIGSSRLTTNDSMGEFLDRWQSGSAQASLIFGDEWTGRAPERIGELLEWRFGATILTPENLTAPAPDDRRHAGVLTFGVHSHSTAGAADFRIGADVAVIGEQTGLLHLQRELHQVLGFPIPTLDDWQIGNTVRGQVSAELGRTWSTGDWQIRPFAEAQAGPETFVRAGVDVTWGTLGRDDLMVRAAATGHRVPAVRGDREAGISLVFGADAAYVADSLYLPESLGYELTPVRTRLRAGVHADWKRLDLFYGLAWLGREFEAQRESQLVGTLQLGLRF